MGSSSARMWRLDEGPQAYRRCVVPWAASEKRWYPAPDVVSYHALSLPAHTWQ